MTEVLYNTCYGGFSFSKAFEAEFAKRFPDKKLNVCTGLASSARYDKDAVALAKEMGLPNAGGANAKLEIEIVLTEMLDYLDIQEYDGTESVFINYSGAFEDLLHDMMKTGGNVEENRERYNALQKHQKQRAVPSQFAELAPAGEQQVSDGGASHQTVP